MKKLLSILMLSLSLVLLFGGCTSTQKKVAAGTAAGAVAGHVIGGDTKSAVIGAGIGAAAGAIISNQTEN